jgi:hypothetical protein
MGKLQDWTNRLAVQLYKHLPWLAARWARTQVQQHRTILLQALKALETLKEPGPSWNLAIPAAGIASMKAADRR